MVVEEVFRDLVQEVVLDPTSYMKGDGASSCHVGVGDSKLPVKGSCMGQGDAVVQRVTQDDGSRPTFGLGV